MSKPQIVLVLENLRSIYNVGAILRTCDGLGVKKIIYIGTTPHPVVKDDARLPFMAKKQSVQIAKTALGAELSISGQYFASTKEYLANLDTDVELMALEQSSKSTFITDYKHGYSAIHLAVGNEVNGVSLELLNASTKILEIPMVGKKESFNVEVAAAIALYQLTLSM